MVHSEVFLNKYVVNMTPFSTPACRYCSLFCMFSLFNMHRNRPHVKLGRVILRYKRTDRQTCMETDIHTSCSQYFAPPGDEIMRQVYTPFFDAHKHGGLSERECFPAVARLPQQRYISGCGCSFSSCRRGSASAEQNSTARMIVAQD